MGMRSNENKKGLHSSSEIHSSLILIKQLKTSAITLIVNEEGESMSSNENGKIAKYTILTNESENTENNWTDGKNKTGRNIHKQQQQQQKKLANNDFQMSS